MSSHSLRAARALAHLGEVDPALAVLSLWCGHRDGAGETRTEGETITYGPGFDTLGLPEQVGLAAHHVLHVALRHSGRQAALAERLGARFAPELYGLAADAIINETLILAGHAIPRPAVTLTGLLGQIGQAAAGPVQALERWDADRLAMLLHRDHGKAEKAREHGRSRGFRPDLKDGTRGAAGRDGKAADRRDADWRNHVLRALEAGRKAGSGLGRLGAILADLAPEGVPWEVHLRGLMAQALVERPRQSWRRPAGAWVAQMAEAERVGGPVPVFQPGRARMDHRPRLVIGLDTSASIDALTLRLLTAEAQAIARRTGAEAHLLAFDEAVFATRRLDPDGWAGLERGWLRTGGGTDYHDLFDRAGKVRPSLAVILTDLEAPLPPKPGFPVLWAVPADPPEPPGYGRFLRIGDGLPQGRGS